MFLPLSCLDKMPEDAIPFDDAIKTVDDVNLAVVGIYDAFKKQRPCTPASLTLLPDLQADFRVWSKRKYEYLRRYLALERHSGYQYKY